LHAALKAWYAQPGDQVEKPVDGYVIDIVRGDELIEIQTRGFSSLRRKLDALIPNHRVRLVYPVALEKWIIRLGPDERTILSRRRSPKHGRALDVFGELPSLARLVNHPHFSIEVALVRTEEIQCNTRGPRRASWRRKGWRIHDRKLIEVVDRRGLETPADFLAFLPPLWLDSAKSAREPRAEYAAGQRRKKAAAPPSPTPDPEFTFTTRELADALRVSRYFAQKITYCLREMGAIRSVGKRGRAIVYAL